jgi:glycosyltransferase AglD
MKGLTLFIPLYNEEKIIKKNLKKIEIIFKKAKIPYELIIIDDNSTDGSRKEIHSINNDKIKYLFFQNGPSRRENLGKSLIKAKYEIIGFTDADLAVSPEYFPRLYHLFNQNIDIVLGSRYKGIEPNREWWRLYISYTYNFFIRLLFNSKIRDHQCGIKIFKKKSIMPILKEMGYDSNFKRGWFWDAELLIRSQKHKLKIIEKGVPWTRGEKSTFSFKRELKMIPYIFNLRLRLFKKR